MRFVIKFYMDNASFQDGTGDQAIEILNSVIDIIKQVGNTEGLSGYRQTLRDYNGNKVGEATVKPDTV